jgi:RNA polymerase sigma factor (sigma-70 family)
MSRPLTTQRRQDPDRVREELLAALPRLRRFARSLAGNRQDGDDLMQTTVERVLERGLPEGVEALPWLFKICKNLWIDEQRARAVRLKAAHTGELDEEPSVSGEAVALGQIGLREIERALDELPAEQRAVLALVAVEGFSYREAAEVLEAPIGTVMSRLSRARAALATRLGERLATSPSDGETDE